MRDGDSKALLEFEVLTKSVFDASRIRRKVQTIYAASRQEFWSFRNQLKRFSPNLMRRKTVFDHLSE
jgi:hypothetical protein